MQQWTEEAHSLLPWTWYPSQGRHIINQKWQAPKETGNEFTGTILVRNTLEENTPSHRSGNHSVIPQFPLKRCLNSHKRILTKMKFVATGREKPPFNVPSSSRITHTNTRCSAIPILEYSLPGTFILRSTHHIWAGQHPHSQLQDSQQCGRTLWTKRHDSYLYTWWHTCQKNTFNVGWVAWFFDRLWISVLILKNDIHIRVHGLKAMAEGKITSKEYQTADLMKSWCYI